MISSEAYTAEQLQNESKNRPSSRLSDWRVAVLILTALWWIIYMVGLSTPALLDDADTVHAEAAREMVVRHDWVTLYANGIRYLEKAPLMYWSVAISYKVFGVNEWSTRFPLMLGVLGMILTTYGLGRWAFGAEGGFDSGLVMVTALGLHTFSHSRCAGWTLADSYLLVVSTIARRRETFALGLLGTGCGLRF